MSRSALAAGVRHLRGKLAAQQCHEQSDEQLLAAFLCHHDDSAFAALVRRHGPTVWHVCRRVLGHQQDAEDAFQATFLVLARQARRLRNQASLASFLHGIAFRTAMKAKQAAARRRKYESQTPPRPNTEPSSALLWDEVRTLLDEEIIRLPEKYRSVFVLFYLHGLSREEAARQLGLKQGTAASRLAEARKRLAQRLTRRGVELAAVLTATSLAFPSASALPPMLMRTTIEAALGDGTSAYVAELARSAASAGMLSKSKIGMIVLMTVGLLTGAGAWTYRTLATQQAGQQQAEPPPAASKPLPPPLKNAKAASPTKSTVRTVKGRVLDPNGQPVKGARLYTASLRKAFPHDDGAIAQAEATDAKGRFRISLNEPDREKHVYLIAHAAGRGVDWINLDEDDLSSEVTLRLVKDVPIMGRVVNTEGRPVAGVTVSVSSIYIPANEKLDNYLNGWYQGLNKVLDTLSTPKKRLYSPLDGISGAATTDKQGRFTLRGAGGERIVHVTFSGGGVAHTAACVITRRGFDPKPYNAVLQKDEDGRKFVEWNRFFGLYPPEFTFVAESGKTIEGVVKDAATGKPLAGCQVVTGTTFAHGIAVVTNAEGEYRLEGLARRPNGYHVWVRPPKNSPYLFRAFQAAHKVGVPHLRLDFELVKGALVTGRVVDKQTGKGVRCYFRSLPLPDNPYFGSTPGFDLGDMDTSREIEVGEDGYFRLVTIPGKALLAARVDSSEKIQGQSLGVYRQAVPDPDHKDLFNAADDTWTITVAGNRLEFLNLENAVKVIDVTANGETKVELSVDGGKTARIIIQDAQGKPLAGAWAAGITHTWPLTYRLPEAAATVYALNPDKPRTMAFFHTEKGLGGTATVRGDEKEPVIVKLAPVGKVSGRLLDLEGNPLEGIEVSISAQTEMGSELYRFAAPSGKPALTDKDGRFHIAGVVPDLPFHLNLRKNRTFFLGEPRIGVKQMQPGQALDLGSLRVKPDR